MLSSSQTTRMFDQIAKVDDAIRKKGWSLRVADDLAKELGVDRRTVYRLRSRANRWTQEQMRAEDVARWRARQVQLADEAAREALESKDYASVAKLIKVGAELTGTIAPTKVDVTHTAVVPANVASVVANMAPEQIRALTERRVIEVESAPVGAVGVGSTDG